MRAFLALPIPGDVREHAIRVSRLLREHGVRGKWVRPEHMHFTLVFLGEAAEPALAELGARLAPELAVVAPVSLTYAFCFSPVSLRPRPPSVPLPKAQLRSSRNAILPVVPIPL